MWGVRLVGAFLCVNVLGLGLRAVWLCMVADNMARFALMLARYLTGRWRRRLDPAPTAAAREAG